VPVVAPVEPAKVEPAAVEPPTALARVDPPELIAAEPAKKKKSPAAEKADARRRQWAEFERLSDDEWRVRMKNRLQRNWRIVEQRAKEANSPTNTAQAVYDPLLDSVMSAKGAAARKQVQQKVAGWETAFLK
jgi:hypothetical protein